MMFYFWISLRRRDFLLASLAFRVSVGKSLPLCAAADEPPRAFLWIFFFSHLILSTKYVFSVPSTSTPPFVSWRNQKPHGNKCVCRCSIQILSRFSFRGAYEFRVLRGADTKRGVERIMKSGGGLLIGTCMSLAFPRFSHHTRIFQLISPIIRLTTARS